MVNLDQYVGQAIEVEDLSNLDQCFDWAFKVCDLLEIPRAAIRTLYAKDIWSRHNPAYFDIVQGSPQMYDFAIWGSQVGTAGHVAIVKQATATGFISWDQNWNGLLKVQVVTHNKTGLLGFLRPKGGSMWNITKELEQEWSLAATGALPGKDYDYRFTGLPATELNIEAAARFWRQQRVTPQARVLSPGIYQVN